MSIINGRIYYLDQDLEAYENEGKIYCYFKTNAIPPDWITRITKGELKPKGEITTTKGVTRCEVCKIRE